MRCKYKLFRLLKGEKLAPVFTNKNRSHLVHDIAQATPRPEWNSPNCWVARPRDAPLPSYFRRGSWLSHSSCQPDRDCKRPRTPQATPCYMALWKSDPALVPRPEKEMQFPEIPVGVTGPQPSRTWRQRTRAVSALPEAPGARASPGLAPDASLVARGHCATVRPPPPPVELALLCCSCSALSSSSNSLPRGWGSTARWERQASWCPGMFFHKGRASERAVSEQPVEEADKKMPLSLPPQDDPGESSPSRTSKKHTPFHIWRSKKKQQPSLSDCGVFVPHPAPASLGEAR